MSLLTHRRRAAAAAAALGTFAITCAGVTPSSAAGTVLWTPSTSTGPSSFKAVQCAAGDFGVVKDSVKGNVWRAFQAAGQERCETLSPDLKEGDTFYLGWSSRVDIKDANSRYVFQLKCSPSTGTANHPKPRTPSPT